MRIPIAKYIGVVSMLIGALWVCVFVVKPLLVAIELGNIFYDIFLPLESLPGLFAILYGFRVIQMPNKANITRSFGYALSCVVIFVSVVAGIMALTNSEREGMNSALFRILLTAFVSGLAAMPIYVWLSSFAMNQESIPVNGLRDFFGKPFVYFQSFLFWSFTSSLISASLPLDFYLPGARFVSTMTLLTAGPALLAWGYYRIFLRIIGMAPESFQLERPAYT